MNIVEHLRKEFPEYRFNIKDEETDFAHFIVLCIDGEQTKIRWINERYLDNECLTDCKEAFELLREAIEREINNEDQRIQR